MYPGSSIYVHSRVYTSIHTQSCAQTAVILEGCKHALYRCALFINESIYMIGGIMYI